MNVIRTVAVLYVLQVSWSDFLVKEMDRLLINESPWLFSGWWWQ